VKKRRQLKTNGTVIGIDAHSEKIVASFIEMHDGVEGKPRNLVTTVEALEPTFKKRIQGGEVAVLEASTNSFSIASRLNAIGIDVRVVTSDCLAGRQRSDKINDRIDAENLARAFISGDTQLVWQPSPKFRGMRDLFFAYRNAVKNATQASNRIWGFMNGHGFKSPSRGKQKKLSTLEKLLKERTWNADEKFLLEQMVGDYEHAIRQRDACEVKIKEHVAASEDMRRIMQVLGIRFIVAFALLAFIEDIRRFETAKSLVRYIGFNPSECSSGTKEGRHDMSRFGRHDLKGLMIQGAQAAMRTGKGNMHKWARHLCVSGKNRNLATCALARKMTVYVWHILMGHPTPNAAPDPAFVRKLSKLASELGKDALEKLGFKSAKEYVETVSNTIYANNKKPPELQTGPLASA